MMHQPLFEAGTTITWTATDSIGVTVTAIQTVTIQDTTDPIFGSTSDLDFVFEPDVSLVVNYDSPTATDSVDDSVDVTCVPASGTVFNEGRTRVTCTATDDSGNTVNTTFNVDVTIFNTTIFFDNFEDRNLDGWFVSDHDDIWRAGLLEEDAYPPDHPSITLYLLQDVLELC